jgi:hypothetical protein
MPQPTYDQKINALKKLLRMFRFERYVHSSLAILSLIVLISMLIVLLNRGHLDVPQLSAIFGSSGLITIALGRVLYLWNQAYQIVFQKK